MNVLEAVGVSTLVAVAGVLARALTRGGGVAAALVGTAILAGTGWAGAAMLGAFFGSSTLVGRLAAARTRVVDLGGERRNARQVLANGAAAALGALLELETPGLGTWVVCGSLAAAAADTWATSVGAFSRTDPRHLVSGMRVPPGTNGGVTLLGTLGALAGAAIVAVTGGLGGGGVRLAASGIAIGFVGMLLDSLLGATLQGRFGHGGSGWPDNDGVNALATTTAALVAAGAWRVLA